MRVKSFGCSFIYGTDLADDGRGFLHATPSQLTWPALIAKKYNLDYNCYAYPGSGNLRILNSVLTHAACNEVDFFVIGWSWIDRFDYVNSDEKWTTILPVDTDSCATFYYKQFHSELRDKLTTLIYIRTAIEVLTAKKIPFLMTHIDNLMFDQRWHAPPSVTDNQDFIKPYISTFNDMTFLEWAKFNKFPISNTLHPLEPAHAAAADIMSPVFEKVRNEFINCSVT